MKLLTEALAAMLVVCAFAVPASGASHRRSTRRSHSHSSHSRRSTEATTRRDAHGRFKRSETAKHHFEVQTGYPDGRRGYVVDHIVPLACGGADVPSNMQWQTVAEAKAKDRTERVGCR